jgi:hypothetical protein
MSQIFTTKNLLLQDVCNQILEIDNSIRFAGFANNMGTVIAAQYRQALMSVEKEKEKKEQPLLTKDELELSVIESALRILTRKDMMSKLGKPIYSFTLYEKVGRATILLDNTNNSGCPPILMVSFDNHDSEGPYPESLILRGILPLVSYYLRY